jgi:hypothetical protein
VFPSGKWRGFWEQDDYGRQWMEPLALHFSGGHVEGEGSDVVGDFTFRGTYSADGAVRLVKQYIGQHSVLYQGRVDGEGAVVGRWSIGPYLTGPFALMPANEAVAGLPILEITATPDGR